MRARARVRVRIRASCLASSCSTDALLPAVRTRYAHSETSAPAYIVHAYSCMRAEDMQTQGCTRGIRPLGDERTCTGTTGTSTGTGGQVGAGKVGGKGIFSAQINVRRRCACRLLLVCGSHFLTPASHCLLTPASYHLPPSYFLLPTADRASCRTRVHRRRSLFLQPSAHNLPTANCLQPSYSHLPTTFLQPVGLQPGPTTWAWPWPSPRP